VSLRDKIDVDAIGDVRMAKIRKAVFERLDAQEGAEPSVPSADRSPRGSTWLRAGAAAIALVAAAMLVVLGATLWPVAPDVLAGANPSRIVTQGAASHLDLGDNAIDVAPASALLTSGDDAQGVLLVLERGSVTCEVAPRRGRPPFVVQAGSTRVRVIGTRFTVTRQDDGARVEVVHGVVEVASGGRTYLLSAGQAWPEGSTPAAAPGLPNTASGPAGAGVADGPPRKRGTAEAPPPPRLVGARTSAATAAPPVNEAPADPEATTARTPEPSAQERFEQASSAEKRDPALAASIYDELASGSGPWAANALFARGRLEADLGHGAQARQTLGAYLARYPSGRNAADARALLARLR
jgi:hypothetical protein